MPDPLELRQEPRATMKVLDLMVQVFAAAVALGLARGAMGVWRNGFDLGNEAAGAAMLALSVWLCVPLARRIGVLSRGRKPMRNRIWPVAWRVVAVLWLGCLAATESALLSRDAAWPTITWPPENPILFQMRKSLLPTLAALALFGITAGLAPSACRPRRAPSLRWVVVSSAMLAGALLMAIGSDIWYLVLIAIDGVTIALPSRSGRVLPDVFMRDAPPLNTRIVRAGWEALAAGVMCAVTGSVLARDLGRDLSVERATTRAMLPRFLLLIATGYAGFRLVFIALPALHPSLLGGLRLAFTAIDVVTLTAAFAILAAGLTSRAVAPPAEPRAAHRPGRTHRRWGVFACLAILGLISAGSSLTESDRNGVREFPWLLWTQESILSVLENNPGLKGLVPYLSFEFLARAVVVSWLGILIARANLPGRVTTSSALDSAVGTRSRIAWFVWGTAGLTVACLAALPMFYLAGISILHLRLRATFG